MIPEPKKDTSHLFDSSRPANLLVKIPNGNFEDEMELTISAPNEQTIKGYLRRSSLHLEVDKDGGATPLANFEAVDYLCQMIGSTQLQSLTGKQKAQILGDSILDIQTRRAVLDRSKTYDYDVDQLIAMDVLAWQPEGEEDRKEMTIWFRKATGAQVSTYEKARRKPKRENKTSWSKSKAKENQKVTLEDDVDTIWKLIFGTEREPGLYAGSDGYLGDASSIHVYEAFCTFMDADIEVMGK